MMQHNNRRIISIEELEIIAARLFPDKKRIIRYNEVRIGNKGSLVINTSGVYYDHGNGCGGSLFKLARKELSCDNKTALDVCNLHFSQSNIPYPSLSINKEISKKAKTSKALKHWTEAKNINGTLGERYFRDHRGITIALPESLRFKSQMPHPNGGYYPAIIASVVSVEEQFLGIHAIYLNPDTGNKIANNPKISFGSVKLGAVRLSKLQNKLVICEGIEDGLSWLQIDPEASVWACLGTSGLLNIEIPQEIEYINILADRDAIGLNTAYRKRDMLLSLGCKVAVTLPTQGYKDINEMLCGGYDVRRSY